MKVWQNVIGVCCGIIAFVGIVLFAAAQFGIEERHIDSFWNGVLAVAALVALPEAIYNWRKVQKAKVAAIVQEKRFQLRQERDRIIKVGALPNDDGDAALQLALLGINGICKWLLDNDYTSSGDKDLIDEILQIDFVTYFLKRYFKSGKTGELNSFFKYVERYGEDSAKQFIAKLLMGDFNKEVDNNGIEGESVEKPKNTHDTHQDYPTIVSALNAEFGYSMTFRMQSSKRLDNGALAWFVKLSTESPAEPYPESWVNQLTKDEAGKDIIREYWPKDKELDPANIRASEHGGIRIVFRKLENAKGYRFEGVFCQRSYVHGNKYREYELIEDSVYKYNADDFKVGITALPEPLKKLKAKLSS